MSRLHEWICPKGKIGYWYCRASFWLADWLPWHLWRRRLRDRRLRRAQ